MDKHEKRLYLCDKRNYTRFKQKSVTDRWTDIR